jgi:hypothetical protein
VLRQQQMHATVANTRAPPHPDRVVQPLPELLAQGPLSLISHQHLLQVQQSPQAL